jgi:hypothetical protein
LAPLLGASQPGVNRSGPTLGDMAAFGTRRVQTGRRSDSRSRVQADARLETVASSKRACLNDISRGGASVTTDLPLRRGTDVFLHWGEIHAFATVVWLDGDRCGLKFDEPLSDDEVRLIQSLSDESFSLEQAQLVSTAPNWASSQSL